MTMVHPHAVPSPRFRAARVSCRRQTPTSLVLLVVAVLCLAQGLSKGVLWVVGERANGAVVVQENMVTTRGATWVRYQFQSKDGARQGGSALTASKNALRTRVNIAYLGAFPALNMPAYGAYSALLGSVWALLGLILLGMSRLFRRKRFAENESS